MDNTEKEARIREVAIKEIEQPTWGVMMQFLEVHRIEYVAGKPNVVRVDTENEQEAVVYFAVKGEEFFYAITVCTGETGLEVCGLDTVDKIILYFGAASETLSADELCAMTSLNTEVVWRKGEKRYPTEKAPLHKNSCMAIEPSPEPRKFEDKLSRLLNYLLEDREGIRKLEQASDVYINAVITCHNAIGRMYGPYLDPDNVKKMAELGLGISFDIYAAGNELKEEDLSPEFMRNWRLKREWERQQKEKESQG